MSTSNEESPKKPHGYRLSATLILWILIGLAILIISLFMASLVSESNKIPENSPDTAPLLAIPSATLATPPPADATPPQATVSATSSVTWEQITQSLQHSEAIQTEIFATMLQKLPALAPLPRPEIQTIPLFATPAPTVTPISWKAISLQLEACEQRQHEVLKAFLSKLTQFEGERPP
jgi:hypothetical protein